MIDGSTMGFGKVQNQIAPVHFLVGQLECGYHRICNFGTVKYIQMV